MRALLSILFGVAVATTAHSAEATAEAAELLGRLPSQRVLKEARDIVIFASSEFHEPKHKTEAELKQAQAVVAIAKEIIPRLRKLIKPGFSVLDFPGLLARGEITWSDLEKHYEIYLGVYLRDVEGQRPYDMKIRFDAKGKIVEVKDVIWKS